MELKFRAKTLDGELIYFNLHESQFSGDSEVFYVGGIPCESGTEQQFIGLQDKNGKEIYVGDILQFSNLAEWYRTKWLCGSKEERFEIINNREKFPYERRTIELPEDYEWLLDSEIQEYWEIIGNIYENPELINGD